MSFVHSAMIALVVLATTSAQRGPDDWSTRQATRRGQVSRHYGRIPSQRPTNGSEPENATVSAVEPVELRHPIATGRNGSVEEPVARQRENQYADMLEKINDRLTGLSALDQQKIRKLESIDYKLTKLEVQLQEKTEALKTELRDVSRRVQQLDWQSTKTDSKVELLKEDVSYLRHTYAHAAQTDRSQACTETSNESQTAIVADRVKQVANTIAAFQSTLNSIRASMKALEVNVTVLNNNTRDILQTSKRDLLTKQFFNSVNSRKQCDVNVVSGPSADREPSRAIPTDCAQLRDVSKVNVSGIYRIRPTMADEPFYAYCDMTTDDGGWTVIQNRFEGAIDFEKGWQDYRNGFGNLNGEFWLGLERIHRMTGTELHELRIDLVDFSLDTRHAKYVSFGVGPESSGYPLMFLGNYTGNAGDSLIYHAGQKFTTHDMDHDNWPEGNCAESHTGAWWYNGCDNSNLNGKYLHGEVTPELEYQGIYWYEWRGPNYSLMKTRMMIRPKPH